MESAERVILSRDCPAIQIPSGDKELLPRGTSVRICQALGSCYTIVTERGGMFRLSETEADAIGKKPVKPENRATGKATTLEDLVWRELYDCYDPEIPVNIVELGLVYECTIIPLAEKTDKNKHRVEIKFTLTAPGCGMGDILKQDIERKIGALPGVASVNAEVVLDPPWDRSMMSEAARLQLGML